MAILAASARSLEQAAVDNWRIAGGHQHDHGFPTARPKPIISAEKIPALAEGSTTLITVCHCGAQRQRALAQGGRHAEQRVLRQREDDRHQREAHRHAHHQRIALVVIIPSQKCSGSPNSATSSRGPRLSASHTVNASSGNSNSRSTPGRQRGIKRWVNAPHSSTAAASSSGNASTANRYCSMIGASQMPATSPITTVGSAPSLR